MISKAAQAAQAGQAGQVLAAELAALGVQPGQDLLVHCSLRQVGLANGGAAIVLAGLRAATGPNATLVVPTHTTENSLSSRAFRNATSGFDAAKLAQFVAAMPGFDPASTPSTGMGRFAEFVRTSPGAIRSTHPQSSFAALGQRAADCVAEHPLDCHLGEHSPLGWLYRANAAVLLLGVGYTACTAFHLAEYRLPGDPTTRQFRCYTFDHGVRGEQTFIDLDLDDGDFEALGTRIDRELFVRRGTVGAATNCRLLPIRDAVDFAMTWPPFRQRRRAGLHD